MANPHPNRKTSRSGLAIIKNDKHGKSFRITQRSCTITCGMNLEAAEEYVRCYEATQLAMEKFLYGLPPTCG